MTFTSGPASPKGNDNTFGFMFAFRRLTQQRPHPILQYRFQCFQQTKRMLWWNKKSDVPAIYKPRKEAWITPTMVIVGIIPFFTFALGTWQLKRLEWKVNLIDELEEKLQLQPLSLPSQIKYVPDTQFTRVSLTKLVFQSYLSLSIEKSH